MIVGVDGATHEVINPLMACGQLPNFKRICDNGVYGPLRSTKHPITPQAWSSFLTGLNAGKHGVYDFTKRKNDSYDIEFINASSRSGETIFAHLSQLGRTVGSIGVPFTFPPEKVNGFILSGFDAPAEDERSFYPPELYNEIKEKFGNYYIHLASPIGRQRKEEKKFWLDIQTEDRNKTDISLYLWEKYPCDFFITHFLNTDRVQHQYFTKELEEQLEKGDPDLNNLVIKSYINVDHQLGKLLDAAEADGNTNVIIMSDHGSGPIKGFFYLNRWLEKQGLFSYLDDRNRAMFNLLEKSRYMAKRFLPRRAKNLLKSLFPQIKDKMESYRFFNDVDWTQTQAYGFGMYGNIFINLKGREPDGIISPGREYEELRDVIIKKLEALTDPRTREKVIEKVYRREELYSGDRVDEAPDLLIAWKNYAYYTSNVPGREKGECFGALQKMDSTDYLHIGTHRLDGIFLAMGPAIKKGKEIQDAHIMDLAPTALYALDEEIPENMDGKVLNQIFNRSFQNTHTKRFTKKLHGEEEKTVIRYSDEERKEVEERLKGLGYI